MSWNVFFSSPKNSNPTNIDSAIIYEKEKQQIFTFAEQEPENIWVCYHYICFQNDQSD